MSSIFLRNFDFYKAIQRFWPAILFAVIGTICSIILVEFERDFNTISFNLLLSSWIGMLVFINLNLIREVYQLDIKRYLLGAVIGLSFVALVYYLLPTHEKLYTQAVAYRFIGTILILHLLVSVVPFLAKERIDSFWQYNRTILVLFFESVFNSMALFIGLTLAILALKFLFNVDLDEKIFLHTFIIILGTFNTVYFLSRFPQDFQNDKISQPSKGYAVFSQFILIPLNLIYIIILYAYGVKIIVEQSLPKGWVSNLVLWFSIIGVLAYLLNYYNSRFTDNPLPKLFKKRFFQILLAPLVLLFVAIFTRISDYGVTENRYIVATLGVWLTFICLYFIISKKDNIKVIPISLMCFILIGIVGPWDFQHTSNRSQKKRLLNMLEEQSLFNANALLKSNDLLDNEKTYQIVSQLNHLDKRHQLVFLNEYEPFKSSVDKLVRYDTLIHNDGDKIDRFKNSREVAEVLNINYEGYSKSGWINEKNISLRSDWDVNVLDIEGYSKAIYFHAYNADPEREPQLPVIINDAKNLLILNIEDKKIEVSVEDFIQRHIESNLVSQDIQADKLSFEIETEEISAIIYFNSVHAYKEKGSLEIGSCNGILVYSLKKTNE